MSADGAGLLIVNADDWGYDEETNAAICDAHRAGGITSTTAMMFMRGTEQAAGLAREHAGLGVGLHLNLVEEYSDPGVPVAVRDRQSRLIEHARLLRLRRWVYDPFVRDEVNRVIADQFQAFVDLYGRLPTHLDGHHQCHLALNVLLSPAVPPGTKIRNALSDERLTGPLTLALRRARERFLDRHTRTTDYFFSVATLWPGLQGPVPIDRLGLARSASVEVMVHPAFPHEHEPLQSEDWVGALAGMPTGTFDDLR
jgi:chitin disaccharide deacetylase